MAKKKKEAPKLRKPEELPSAASLLKEIAARKEQLKKVSEKVLKEGKPNLQDPKYRVALKNLKREQRKLRKEIVRAGPAPRPKEGAENK